MRGTIHPVLRRRPKERLAASIFADDLLAGCDDLYRVMRSGHAGPIFDDRGDTLTLPISIPIGSDGLVRLQPAGPVDAPRVASTLVVTRSSPAVYGLRVERSDGRPIRLPGVNDGAPVSGLTFGVTREGLHITDVEMPLRFDEDTARALANALLITIHMKLLKAGNE